MLVLQGKCRCVSVQALDEDGSGSHSKTAPCDQADDDPTAASVRHIESPDRGSSLTPEQEKIIRQAGRGRPWKADCSAAQLRNETLCATRHFGRAFWKRWTGYHAPSWIAAKDPDRQTAEIQIRVAIMNRFNALGIAEIIRVA